MPSYLNYVQILIILASMAVASPVERRDATCQPNFNYQYNIPNQNPKQVAGLVRFVSQGQSTWKDQGGLSKPAYVDVKDCASAGTDAAASNWVQYMSRPLRTWAWPGEAGVKRCQTFRMNSGDGIWSCQQPTGVYSIESYKTYARKVDGQAVNLGSNIGWEASGNGLVWNTFPYNKKDSQLWRVDCERCNQDSDATAGFVARNCTITVNKSNPQQCILAGQNNAMTVGPCPSDPKTDTSGLWHITLVDANDASVYQYSLSQTENILE